MKTVTTVSEGQKGETMNPSVKMHEVGHLLEMEHRGIDGKIILLESKCGSNYGVTLACESAMEIEDQIAIIVAGPLAETMFGRPERIEQTWLSDMRALYCLTDGSIPLGEFSRMMENIVRIVASGEATDEDPLFQDLLSVQQRLKTAWEAGAFDKFVVEPISVKTAERIIIESERAMVCSKKFRQQVRRARESQMVHAAAAWLMQRTETAEARAEAELEVANA